MRLRIDHRTSYAYASPLERGLQIVRLFPKRHDGQEIVRWRVLGARGVELRLVLELEQELEGAAHAQLLVEPARDGVGHVLATARVAATGVGPVVRPQPLAGGAALQQQVALLSDGTVERDMLDEQARRALNMAQPGELVILRPFE